MELIKDYAQLKVGDIILVKRHQCKGILAKFNTLTNKNITYRIIKDANRYYFDLCNRHLYLIYRTNNAKEILAEDCQVGDIVLVDGPDMDQICEIKIDGKGKEDLSYFYTDNTNFGVLSYIKAKELNRIFYKEQQCQTSSGLCPECKGSGKYIGLNKIDTCAACSGFGRI